MCDPAALLNFTLNPPKGSKSEYLILIRHSHNHMYNSTIIH